MIADGKRTEDRLVIGLGVPGERLGAFGSFSLGCSLIRGEGVRFAYVLSR